jgi:hypothetical protein
MAFRIRLRSRPPHYLTRWPQVSRLRIGLPESPVAQRHYVTVTDVRVEHEVKPMDFTKWLERTYGPPREVSDRHCI